MDVEKRFFLWVEAVLGYNFLMLINLPLPDFALRDTAGQLHKLSQYRGRLVVVNFWSAECPWSARADAGLLTLTKRFAGRVLILPVASNLSETREMINLLLQERGLDFVLMDEDCRVAEVCGAQTTPHAFILDQGGILRYQGAVDDVTFRKRIPERFYVAEALAALLEGRLPEVQETPAYGCSIVKHI
jgi:hypothetical protein